MAVPTLLTSSSPATSPEDEKEQGVGPSLSSSPVMGRRKSQLEKIGDFRDGQKVIEETKAAGKKAQKTKAAIVGNAVDYGVISSRTGAEAVAQSGANPFAVAELGENIMLSFRRKSMALIICQSIYVNAIAFGIDRFASLPKYHWALYMSTWTVPVILLGILTCARHKVPANYILLFVFSMMLGVTFGLLHEPMRVFTEEFAVDRDRNWSPQCYGMAGHTIGLCLLFLLTCFRHPGRGVVKMAPMSVMVALVTDVVGVLAYMTHWNYVGPPLFIGFAIVMHTLSLVWVGYQMDSLSGNLQVTEWLYPVILLWCEVFIAFFAMAVFFATLVLLLIGGSSGGEVSDGNWDGVCDGCYFLYCDCYYTGDEKSQKQGEVAPKQVAMNTEV
eukprot:TRINITY_DN4350_c0_g1_i6.p1 TRINITY_DN4350_c0_g1~~TRINITY_DN4350_c0_g1_i6.p1  ORF type:complete len:404 (-),score=70.54 TRINITY_DN4350_c0_g1_i6:106-1263(-)